MENSLSQDHLSLHGVPFDQKWTLLKPTIERLFIDENLTLPNVIKAIRKQYGFDAAESQYKYQINKKWKLKKNISTSKKAAVYQAITKRAQLGKSSAITYRGREFDTKKLRRYLKTEIRRALILQPGAGEAITDVGPFSGRISVSGIRIFMNWNMPYGAKRSSVAPTVDHVSPLSDIMVATPPSQTEAPSPTAVAVRQMSAVERTRLFVQGKHMELLNSMGKSERLTLSTWMYQYWLFAFKTAKHWGRGPRDWTAGILGFDEYHQRTTISISSPSPSVASKGSPTSQSTPRIEEKTDSMIVDSMNTPSSLCRWSIHYREIGYDGIPSPPDSPTEEVSLSNERSWPTWPGSSHSGEYMGKLSSSLDNNHFSNVKLDDLPIAVDQIARAVRRSPNELLKESLGFSIMSRNVGLMEDLLSSIEGKLDATGLYPFHLAATYLDGSKQCCSILDRIISLEGRSLRRLDANELGHTILDQLMITILKAHTSCPPSVVDPIFKKEKRFEGEDVDICGRWDADSDCIRTLFANGISRIPFEWKHMFCHTSAQTICHCIGAIFGPSYRPNIDAPSGLFVRRCLHCGLKLQLLPLHTLILVGLHLSHFGCEKENLFGILACLLCLLHNGANPLLKANISVQALLGNEEGNECGHEQLDPAELAEKVLASSTLTLSSELSIGWQIMCNVLRYAQAEWKIKSRRRRSASITSQLDDRFDASIGYSQDEMSTDEEASYECPLPTDCPDEGYWVSYFGRSKVLASLWAAVQTELLTYRRLEERDEWISTNFDMPSLNEGLIRGGEVDIRLVREKMMKPFCACGCFHEAVPECPIIEDAAAYYFSNLDDWNRTSFVESPSWRWEDTRWLRNE